MTRSRYPIRISVLAALALPLLVGIALAQEQRPQGGFLDNLFSRGEQGQQSQGDQSQAPPRVAQTDPGDVSSRVDRIEAALRQLTGTIEELQHQNQMLQMQLKRMQDDTEYRFQQLGSRGGQPPAATQPRVMPPPGASGQRSDVFNPAANPNAPGAPRALGNEQAAAPIQAPEAPVGAPGGRVPGAPLDLSTLAGNPPPPQQQQNVPMADAAPPPAQQQLPQPARTPGAAGTQLATLPPSATSKDEYDMAYGYVLHKDYALAEQAFRDFLRKYPDERLVPDAQYWLGETLFQRQRYRDAAESFLAVSTKFEHSGKAPDALLRLGQSLAALNQKEAACATLAEVGRKFPKASAIVKRGVAAEQKRVHC
jgi:tol-pal system protein YbgF